MIYGLYLSATGVQTNSHNQDVISNNLANAETAGFKRSLTVFQARRMEALTQNARGTQPTVYDNVGGGQLLAPTVTDFSQGSLENSSNPLDTALTGKGYYAVASNKGMRLTRDGQMTLDHDGYLSLVNTPGSRVLDTKQQPIRLENRDLRSLSINDRGDISVAGERVASLGLFAAEDKNLRPAGENLLAVLDDSAVKPATEARVQSNFYERSNVEPTTELTRLMESQRLLEANANFIRTQDATLAKLVNDVGRIG